MRFLMWLGLAVGIGVTACALGACSMAITALGNFPGETCTDRASIRMIEVNWRSHQSYVAEYGSGELLPDLVAVEDVSDISVDPGSEGGNRRYCRGVAVFADGSREAVWSSWFRNYRPNMVSGPGFSHCISDDPTDCGRAAPPGTGDE